MSARVPGRRWLAIALALAVSTTIGGCGSKEPAPAATAPPAPASTPAAAPAAAPAPVTAEQVANQAWTPEALEDLLAPIALYPDPVLSQVLVASTNPQEVLDAGNWLIANEKLSGKALDEAAAKVGFTPPVRALVQFPQTIDMMCMELDWTDELGRAFVADQAGVLDAVQRLRHQAMEVGNLKSSDAMKVDVERQEGEEVVVLKPPKPEVVYVPTYDPVTVYAPPATSAPAPAAPTTTTTTTSNDDDDGHSTGALITTGLLAFGAGILVNEVFDDDDDYYYPHYGYGGMPYYPPYPYRPVYGGGYYPSNGYNRPPNWNGGFQNNGNIIINTGGNQYWDRYDQRPGGANARTAQRNVSSPITQARPNRTDLAQLNQRTPRAMPDTVARPSNKATASDWKGQSSYAGRDKRPASNDAATRIAEASPKYSSPAAGSKAGSRPPKVQGSYAGKERARPASQEASRPTPSQREQPRAEPATRDVKKPGGDRGYGTNDVQRQQPREVQRPSPSPSSRDMGGAPPRDTALSGASRGGQDRAASQRGRQSMPQGARSKGGGGQKNRPGR